jgi:hypothetical protein
MSANGLFLNRGADRFEDASEAWGIAIDARYDTCAFADIDHDGLLDLYVNGTVTGGVSYRDHVFRNAGNRYLDETPANIRSLEADHGVQWADYDRDGDADYSVMNWSTLPQRARYTCTSSTRAATRFLERRCASTERVRVPCSAPASSIPAPATTVRTRCLCTSVWPIRPPSTSR